MLSRAVDMHLNELPRYIGMIHNETLAFTWFRNLCVLLLDEG